MPSDLDYMGIIAQNDRLTITSRMKNPEEMKILCKMLENNRFMVVTQGDMQNGEYYITTQKER